LQHDLVIPFYGIKVKVAVKYFYNEQERRALSRIENYTFSWRDADDTVVRRRYIFRGLW